MWYTITNNPYYQMSPTIVVLICIGVGCFYLFKNLIDTEDEYDE
jgi:hypothetical protein